MTEQVVSSRVIGSSNPIARKFRSIGSSIKGVGCGIVLLIVGLVLIYSSIYSVKEYSKIVAGLQLKTPQEVTADEGMVKVQDKPENVQPAVYTYNKCATSICDPQTLIAAKVENVYYFEIQKQRFEVVKHVTRETQVTTFAGEDVEQTVEKTTYKEEWVTKAEQKGYGQFNLGAVTVKLNADTRMITDLTSAEVPNVQIENLTPLDNYGQAASAAVGTTKMVVSTFPVSEQNLLVVGNVAAGSITSGDPFIVTTKNDTQLAEALKTEEDFQRVALMIVSWFCAFIGLSMLIAPILELIDWIPLFGAAAKIVASVIAFIIATVLVLGGWLIMKFWYLAILCFVLVIVLAVVMVSKNKGRKKEAPASTPAKP